MDAAEVEEVERNHVDVVLKLLGVGVGLPREPDVEVVVVRARSAGVLQDTVHRVRRHSERPADRPHRHTFDEEFEDLNLLLQRKPVIAGRASQPSIPAPLNR